MNRVSLIKEALSEFSAAHDTSDGVAVETQCLYPSGGGVVVYVLVGTESCFVTERGDAVGQLYSHGVNVSNEDKALGSYWRSRGSVHGLQHKAGAIVAEKVPFDALSAAIILVANTASMFAHWALEKFSREPRVRLVDRVKPIVLGNFSKNRVSEEAHLIGASHRRYTFDYLVNLDGNNTLLVDAVLPHASSINSKVVAHMDVGRMANDTIIQRLVYDESDVWKSADLSLLGDAAQLVPITRLHKNLSFDRLH